MAALRRRGILRLRVLGNVYADHRTIGQDESAPLLAPLDGDVMESMESYGAAKVACEQQVERHSDRSAA